MKFRAVLPVLLDVVVPLVGYYLLRAAGCDEFWSLSLAGAATAGYALVSTLRRRRLDNLGLLIVIELALSVALFAATRDPRIVLLKPSFFTAVAGMFLIWTCVQGQPLTIQTSRPFAAADGPEQAARYDAAADHSPEFLREHVRITLVWAALWLVESVVRTVVVLGNGVDQGVLLSQIPGAVAILAGIVYTRLRVPTLTRLVEAMPTPA